MAEFQGFFFQRRQGKLDWRRIASVDLDRIVSQVDVDALQANLEHITFSDVTQDDLAYMPEGNYIKLFRMCQLTIEYLLNVQNYFLKQTHEQQEKIKVLEEEVASVRTTDKKKEVEIKSMKREMRFSRKVLKAYENTIGSMAQPGGAGKRVTSGGDVVYKCAECSAGFISEQYLMKHMNKRHPHVEYAGAVHATTFNQPAAVLRSSHTGTNAILASGGGANRSWLEQWGDKVSQRMENTLKMQIIQNEHHMNERLSRMQEEFKTFVQSQLMSMVVQKTEAEAASQHHHHRSHRRAMAGPLLSYDGRQDMTQFPEQTELQARVLHDKIDSIAGMLRQSHVMDGLLDRRTTTIIDDLKNVSTIVTTNQHICQEIAQCVQARHVPISSFQQQGRYDRSVDDYAVRYGAGVTVGGGAGASTMYNAHRQSTMSRPPPSGTHAAIPSLPFLRGNFEDHSVHETAQATQNLVPVLNDPHKLQKLAREVETDLVQNPQANLTAVARNVDEIVRDYYTQSDEVADRVNRLSSARRVAQGHRGLDAQRSAYESPTKAPSLSFRQRSGGARYGRLNIDPVRDASFGELGRQKSDVPFPTPTNTPPLYESPSPRPTFLDRMASQQY